MIDEKVTLVQANIRAAHDHLLEITDAMRLLEQAGMYPAVPHFQWQDRNGDGKYLYLIFRQNGDGSYMGPDGKKKVYIGNSEEKIEEAKRMTKNRLTWQELEAKAAELIRRIKTCQSMLVMLERDADSLLKFSNEFPKFELTQAE